MLLVLVLIWTLNSIVNIKRLWSTNGIYLDYSLFLLSTASSFSFIYSFVIRRIIKTPSILLYYHSRTMELKEFFIKYKGLIVVKFDWKLIITFLPPVPLFSPLSPPSFLSFFRFHVFCPYVISVMNGKFLYFPSFLVVSGSGIYILLRRNIYSY